jgi:hypothetical protein
VSAAYHATSAKTGEGVSALFHAVAEGVAGARRAAASAAVPLDAGRGAPARCCRRS